MDIRRHHILIAIVVFMMFALLLKPDLLSILFVFVFMGIVPGTDITLPWWATMLGFLLLLGLSIVWLFDQPNYRPVATPKDKSRRHAARKRVIKQTSARTHAATSKRYKKQVAKA